MASRGAVYHHKRFKYPDGGTGRKYIVLLNNSEGGGLSLVLKTTSQRKRRPITPGCIADWGLFFIPAQSAHFPKDTWVQLFPVFPIQNLESDEDIDYFGHLPDPLFRDLLDCLLESQAEDLTQAQLEILLPQSSVSLKHLADHFNNKRQ